MFRFFSTLLVMVIASSIKAQSSLKHIDILAQYKEAKEHYNYERYAICYPIMQNFIANYQSKVQHIDNIVLADAVFTQAACAKYTQALDAKAQLTHFIETFPGDANINSAYFLIGELAFDEKNYTDVLMYFEKVNEKQLSKKQSEEFEFKYAFAQFTLKKFNEAKPKFNAIGASKDHFYKEDGIYYSGLCSYYTNNYTEANKQFKQLENSTKYGKIVPYYITSILFNNKDYTGVVSYAEPRLKEAINYKPEILHLLGNAHYELQHYDKAKYYLEEYKASSAKATPEDFYILGYVQAQEKDCKSAIANFLELSPLENELGQNAMFQLAKCYVKVGQKQDAKDAFYQVSRLEFNKAIQEEAIFQYAKLSYELNNINDALVTLKKFIVDYPKSPYYNEANEIMADIFLITKNYDEAMSIIEKLPLVSTKLQTTYQQMAYLRALSLYNDKNLIQADALLNKALKYTNNKSYEALTYYWKAEIAHQNANFQQSENLLEKFFLINKNINTTDALNVNAGTANYLQGYNYYKEKKYATATTYFLNAVTYLKSATNEELKQTIYPDALVRLGDAYFIQKQYQEAEKNYDVIVKNNYNGTDYSLYQKSIIDGLQNRYAEKIIGMLDVATRFPNSAFADDAYFQAGNTQLALNKLNDATQSYKTLIQKYPKSEWIADAYIKLGLIEYNKDNYDVALDWYKKVVEEYKQTPQAHEAMMVIKDIYIEKGDANGYIKYAAKYGNVTISSSAQDSILYLSAETQFQKGNLNAALQGFNDYILQYPNGYFSLQAKFYKAECNFSLQQYDKALPDYQFVAGEPTNRFTEKATARCANILYYDKKDYEAAKTYYYKLETIATLEENKREYLIGLMRTNYKLKNYALCLQYVDKVKQLINLPEFYKKEISYYKGMAHFNIKEYDKAINDLQTTANGFNNEQGAEAQYSLAKLYYEKKNNKQAEAECMKYTDQFPAYEYYLGKTYILLSDIYVQKNNLLQAKATLQALVDNYSQQDDVMAEAKDKLQQIVDKENKKSNLKLPNTGTQLQFDNNQK